VSGWGLIMNDLDFFTPGARLALELECLLLDTRNDAAQSRWWDSAHEALEQWRRAVRAMERHAEAEQHRNGVMLRALRLADDAAESVICTEGESREGVWVLTAEQIAADPYLDDALAHLEWRELAEVYRAEDGVTVVFKEGR
jgi:hypothetical protein